MKLIFCQACHDVFSLRDEKRKCYCGLSWGMYEEDGLNASIGGAAVPLGFDNLSFAQALNNRPKEGMGRRFEAFVIPRKAPTIIKKIG